MWIDSLDSWVVGLAVCMSQVLFIIFRTMNVVYIARGSKFASAISNALVYWTWVFGTAIGVKSVFTLDIPIIIWGTIGGVVGSYVGLWLTKKLH